MGANIRLRIWADWYGHRLNVAPQCGRCRHVGSVDPWQVHKWALAHRWPASAEVSVRKFKCSKCGGRACRLRATSNKPTMPLWGPDDREWKRLLNRRRG